MQTSVHEDSQIKINPLFHLQPMQLTEERGDVVKPRNENTSRTAAFIID